MPLKVYIAIQVNPVLNLSSESGVSSEKFLPTLSSGSGQPVA